MKKETEKLDLAIIGAGIYGIQAARTYLEVRPDAKVVVFEASSYLGGVWSQERVYDDFWTQTPVGIAEFSDQQLQTIPEKNQYYGFFPAKYITEYLEEYVESHVYHGQSLRERIHFNSHVNSLKKDTCCWKITTDSLSTTFAATRVIDTSGLTSSPHIPHMPGLQDFKGVISHSMQYGNSQLLCSEHKPHVIVIGGAKSAADMAYSCAKSGKKVSWLIRKSGSGPASLALAEGSGPYRNSNESFYTRVTALFLASMFTFGSLFEKLLYQTSVGMFLFSAIWKKVTSRAWNAADYDRLEGRMNGFHNLKPDTEIFWQNDSTGINQRPDFYEQIARNVMVLREDVERVSERGLHLANSTFLFADVLLFGTGWNLTGSYSHINNSLACKLGLPVDRALETKKSADKWSSLHAKAEEKILSRYPILSNPPQHHSSSSSLTPLRLYKAMMPLADPSILFLGKVSLGNHFRAAEVQALWAVACLDGAVAMPEQAQMEQEIAETVAWCQKRYLGKGETGNWFWFDTVPYTDMLLDQLGLTSHRKKGWKDLLQPCWASDLKNLIEEYKEKHKSPSRDGI